MEPWPVVTTNAHVRDGGDPANPDDVRPALTLQVRMTLGLFEQSAERPDTLGGIDLYKLAAMDTGEHAKLGGRDGLSRLATLIKTVCAEQLGELTDNELVEAVLLDDKAEAFRDAIVRACWRFIPRSQREAAEQAMTSVAQISDAINGQVSEQLDWLSGLASQISNGQIPLPQPNETRDAYLLRIGQLTGKPSPSTAGTPAGDSDTPTQTSSPSAT